MISQLRHFLLGRWAHLIARRPRLVLTLAGLLAIASIILTAAQLQFQADRNDLLSRSLPWNQTFIDWQQTFPGKDDLIVIADFGSRPQPEGSLPSVGISADQRRVFQDLALAIEKAAAVEGIHWRFPQDHFSPKTIRLLPWDRFEQQADELAASRSLIQSPSPPALITNITRELNAAQSAAPATPSTPSPPSPPSTPPAPANSSTPSPAQSREARALAQVQGLDHLIAALSRRLATNDARPTLGEVISGTGDGYRYLTPDDRFHFIRVTPRRDPGSLNEFATAITAIRAVIDEHRPAAAAVGIELGMTGIPVIEMDETQVATLDSTIASIVSVVLIALLLMVAFYSVRTPLLAVASLLIGIAWTFGYVTLAIGHLQVISVVFTVMLLSLGIAYGIHIAARFELIRHHRAGGPGGFVATLRDTFETVGPGVFTGAITTAAAFATTLFTNFKGVAEMGNIAAVGILLCLLAMFSVFPALLRIFRSEHRHFKRMSLREFTFFNDRWVMPFARRPRRTVGITILITAASLAAVSRMHFDFDLLNLFPRGVESIDWQNRLSQAGRPIYFGAAVCDDLEDARSLSRKFENKATISPSFGGIGLLFPPDEARKIDRLNEVRTSLITAQTELDTGNQPDLAATLDTLQLALTFAAARQMPQPFRDALTELGNTITQARATLEGMDDATRVERLARLDAEYRAWRGQAVRMILATLDVSPLTRDDLPPQLIDPYIAADGRVVMEVYPRLPANIGSILDPAFLPHYVADMESVDPNITGPAPQIYRSGVLIKESYQLAGLFALAIVFVLVYLDFMRLIDALLCLIPVVVGFAATFGLMWLLDMQINPANIIVLPLMFGIGVDAGVHVIHRYRQSPTTRPLGLSEGTGKGITITNLATVLGFATLLFARHRGVASLGFVLTTGIALTTLACWCVMPAVLELFSAKSERKSD